MNFLRKTVSVFVIAFISVSLLSCQMAEAPDKVVLSAFQALKENDRETLSKYLNIKDLQNLGDQDVTGAAASDEVFKAMFAKLETKILTSSTDKDKAVVKAEFTNVDMQSVLGNYFVQAIASAFSDIGSEKTDSEKEAEISKLFLDLIENETGISTNTVDIHLTKVDKQWKIEIDESLQNAILGGLISAVENLSESFKAD